MSAQVRRPSRRSRTEAPLALREFAERVLEIAVREFWPFLVCENQLRVRCLERHEIRRALLAACAEDEIRIGLAVGVEVPLNRVFVEVTLFQDATQSLG